MFSSEQAKAADGGVCAGAFAAVADADATTAALTAGRETTEVVPCGADARLLVASSCATRARSTLASVSAADVDAVTIAVVFGSGRVGGITGMESVTGGATAAAAALSGKGEERGKAASTDVIHVVDDDATGACVVKELDVVVRGGTTTVVCVVFAALPSSSTFSSSSLSTD